MQFKTERQTVFSVGEGDVKALVQDVRRFLVASGSSEEDSIRFDEASGVWRATSKDGIPMLPKPSYTAQMEKTAEGARWTIEAGLGIKMVHLWTVEAVSEQECTAREDMTCQVPFYAFHAVKWQLPQTQAKTHQSLQDFLS